MEVQNFFKNVNLENPDINPLKIIYIKIQILKFATKILE